MPISNFAIQPPDLNNASLTDVFARPPKVAKNDDGAHLLFLTKQHEEITMANFYNRTGFANGNPNQENSLILDYSTSLMPFIPSPYYKGIHLEAGVVIDQATGQTILNYSNIDLFEITGTKSNDILIGGDYDRNAGNPGNPYDDDQLYGGDGDDRLEGRGGDDRLSGGNGNDVLIGGDGQDELSGGAGNDIIYGGAGDFIMDDSGINQIYANEAFRVTAGIQTTLHTDYSGANYINGIRMGIFNGKAHISNGIDGSLNFDGGMVFDIKGSQQDDVIGDGWVLGGNDSISGNGGNDVVNAGAGNDYLDGGSGNDSLSGGAGADVVYGGSGNDTLNGGAGLDIIYGEGGDDTLIDTDGILNGGAGFDTLVADYTKGAGAINFSPSGSVQLNLNGIESFNIKGTQFADTLTGGIYKADSTPKCNRP